MKHLFTPALAVLLSACTAQVEIGVDSAPPEPSPITWTECSQNVGDHPCDMTLSDQHAETWSLYGGWGDIQVLDFSTGWCSYCNASGSTLQSIQDEYAGQGVIFITVLIEDTYGNPATPEFAAAWAEHYGITAPVVAGSRELISDDPEAGWPINGWPRYFFITRDLLLGSIQAGYSDGGLRNTVDAMLAAERSESE